MNQVTAFLIALVGAELDRGVMTQGQLARKAGYSEKYVSEMMNGHKGSLEGYSRLLDALGIKLTNV